MEHKLNIILKVYRKEMEAQRQGFQTELEQVKQGFENKLEQIGGKLEKMELRSKMLENKIRA